MADHEDHKSPAAEDGGFGEDMIDVRVYVNSLTRRWWIILIATLLPALLVLGYELVQVKPIYQASAGVLIAQTRSNVTFDPRFQTQEQVSTNAVLSQQARRAGLVDMVKNGAIARVVAERLEEETGRQMSPLKLMATVNASQAEPSIKSQAGSDYISITAAGSTPAEAALIANTWAQAYEEFVNELYGSQSESYLAMQQQAGIAQETYQQAEQAVVDYLGQSQLEYLAIVITDTQRLVGTQLTDRHMTLEKHQRDRRLVQNQLADAQTMYQQVKTSGDNGVGSNELAILLLKAEIYGTSAEMPSDIQLAVTLEGGDGTDAQTQQADLEALVSVLEERLAALDASIEADLAAPLPESIQERQATLAPLKARLENEESTLRELNRARDLAWDTYSAVRVKADELAIESSLADVEVRFVAPALEPRVPQSRGVLLSMLVAALAGFVLSSVIILLIDMSRGWPAS